MAVFNGQLKDNTIIVVLGATGDLAKKKTYPALFTLFRLQHLPQGTKIVGYARTKMEETEFHRLISSYFKNKDDPEIADKIEEFNKISTYVSGVYDKGEAFDHLNEYLQSIESKYQNKECNRVFYVALPLTVLISVMKNLKEHCYSTNGINRIIVEQPFGTDLESVHELLSSVKQYWTEEETFRIDHFLGKEMVRNLFTLRFANIVTSAIWDKNSISNVQITLKEPFGTEGRGGYFDKMGIIRDIHQNHLLRILSILAMERPVSFSSEDVRDEKVKVLRSIIPVMREDTLLGQYVAADGKPGYLDDDTVPKDSHSPTYAATTLWINNPRWKGVPFILQAGKALNESKVEVRIQFKDIPQGIFNNIDRNELVIRVQPSAAVHFKLSARLPGLNSCAVPTGMDLRDKQLEDAKTFGEYENLILDVLKGDLSNFVRDDELDVAWTIFTPLLDWIDGKREPSPHLVPYPYGSRGPPMLWEFLHRYGLNQRPSDL